MGEPRAFISTPRRGPTRRPIELRVHDWREVYEPFDGDELRAQAARCMDCGIPFCHEGCPLGNLIPEWNDLVYRGRVAEAAERLHATNNFPEFTGRLCPAPCEGSCVLGINADPVLIKQVELEIAEWATVSGPAPLTPLHRTGKRVAVAGSGPAGLAAAQQLTRAGHEVVVFERAERIGGLLRYGIPEFKMEKAVLDRRLAQMEAEGTRFEVGISVGAASGAASPGPSPGPSSGAASPGDRAEAVDEVTGALAPGCEHVPARRLLEEFDALVLAGGATRPRDLEVPGRSLDGVCFAMDYLKPANLVSEGALDQSPISAEGKNVVIIGGGDTGADCLGTVHRQGALSVRQLEILPTPPQARAAGNPWPTWPVIFRTSSAHEEGGDRLFGVMTTELVDDGHGRVRALRLQSVTTEIVNGRPELRPAPGSEIEVEAELVLIAMGFVGVERSGVVSELGLELDARGNVAVDRHFETSTPSVYACGDIARGQSLIVWAIAEGRSAAAAVDRALMGVTALPEPILPGQLALR
jgi:glutamate synthase (NADPH/NADH) small chain